MKTNAYIYLVTTSLTIKTKALWKLHLLFTFDDVDVFISFMVNGNVSHDVTLMTRIT